MVKRSASGTVPRGTAPFGVVALLGAAVSIGSAPPPPPRFVDAAAAAGIDFVHRHGGTGEKYSVETMGAGACWLDFDGDDWPDLYLVNGAALPGADLDPAPRNRLYRNRGDGTFVDVTAAAGVGDRGYGMGCSSADIDNDGDADLYLTNYGPNVLYRNEGDGTFTDITAAAGVGDPLWGTSSAFADYDGDGDLDLYLSNYVDFNPEKNRWCGDYRRGMKSYCHPDVYEAQPDRLYRNRGDGTFEEVAAAAGVRGKPGKGLGVVWTDYDRDGDPDLYVANDSTPNFLYRNEGAGSFSDATLRAGVGYSEDGRAEAGMGTDFGDFDNDGWFDLFVTNLSGETNTLYRNNHNGTFTNQTFPSGLGAISLTFLGFGVDFFDYDNDGDQDLFVVNGHVLDDIGQYNDAVTYAERNFLFVNRGDGTFAEIGSDRDDALRQPNVGRGLAVADVDRDGDLDLLITTSNGPPRLLRNEMATGHHWVRLRLEGTTDNRSAIGARVRVVAGGREQVQEVRSGSSYLSQNELPLHFGLGAAARIDRIEVTWPDGTVQVWRDLPVDAARTLRQAAAAANGS